MTTISKCNDTVQIKADRFVKNKRLAVIHSLNEMNLSLTRLCSLVKTSKMFLPKMPKTVLLLLWFIFRLNLMQMLPPFVVSVADVWLLQKFAAAAAFSYNSSSCLQVISARWVLDLSFSAFADSQKKEKTKKKLKL